MKYSMISTLVFLFATASIVAQVGIGTTNPNAAAALDITSTTQGFLPPRITFAERNSIITPTPAGLIVWCSDCGVDGELQVFNGTSWTNVIGGPATAGPPEPFSNQLLGLDIDGEAAGDQSGRSVSLSADGGRVAIGASRNDGNGADSGHVRIYDWDGVGWVQTGADINGEAPGDWSGYSVSLSGDGTRVAIGAGFNQGNGYLSGHVRIYDWNGVSWVQTGSDIDSEVAGDSMGSSVSLSGNGMRIAIGAPGNDGNGSNSGHVRLYDWDGLAWVQKGADIDGEAASNISGEPVSLSADGTRVAIGASSNAGNGNFAGHVRLYDWDGTTWVQTGSDIDGEAAGDQSGRSVSLSADGGRVAIGAIGNDGNGADSGHVRIYDWDGVGWVQTGADINGEAPGDWSGYSVSLSGDGIRVAIGAILNNGNGATSGQVRLYEWDGIAWFQTGVDIDGEAAGNQSGESVSLSADGTRVAIGARQNVSSGHVRIFQ